MWEVGIQVIGGGPRDLVLVPAQLVDFNIYKLLDFDRPADCELQFEPGDLVTTIPLPGADGNDVLVALGLYLK